MKSIPEIGTRVRFVGPKYDSDYHWGSSPAVGDQFVGDIGVVRGLKLSGRWLVVYLDSGRVVIRPPGQFRELNVLEKMAESIDEEQKTGDKKAGMV